jgi:hypothetical protein
VNIVSVYCTGWTETYSNEEYSNETGDALAVVSHPMLVLGDFYTHNQSRARFRICLMILIWSTLMTVRLLGLLPASKDFVSTQYSLPIGEVSLRYSW